MERKEQKGRVKMKKEGERRNGLKGIKEKESEKRTGEEEEEMARKE